MMREKDKKCAGCGSDNLETFLDLGHTPLANSYPTKEGLLRDEPRFRLAVSFCPSCSLVQLTDTVPPEEMFSEYLYFSSYSESFLRHAASMAETLTNRFGLGDKSFVLEIASNDGYLLKNFVLKGIPVLGVEPAANVAEVARKNGVPTATVFFNMESARKIRDEYGPADIIIGNNVMAHVPAIKGFTEAVKVCLKEKGAGVFEVPWLKTLIESVEFDTVYHEHVYYFSLTALVRLFERAGLSIFDVEHQVVHGGSLRIFACIPGAYPVSQAVEEILKQEGKSGLTDINKFREFAGHVKDLRENLRLLLNSLKEKGKKIGAYGAAAKGSTLLNYCGVDSNTIDFVADRNSYKQGRYMPGVHIPIVSPEEVEKRRPDYLLILPWNLKDEIMEQMGFVRKWGCKFIVPVPEVKVIE